MTTAVHEDLAEAGAGGLGKDTTHGVVTAGRRMA
jgi:hypothetical protein